MATNRFESPWLYGLHDPGGEQLMLDAGKPGWVVFTAALGTDPANRSGIDFRQFSTRGLGVICRLNNGYYPQGTLPHSSEYGSFARRCANFVSASPGCHIWIVGNEPNFSIERPQAGTALAAPPRTVSARQGWWSRWLDLIRRMWAKLPTRPRPKQAAPPAPKPEADPGLRDPYRHGAPERFNALYGLPPTPSDSELAAFQAAGGEVITPSLYARCYHLCREAIRRLPGHEQDLVLVAPVAPWNNQTVYPGNTRGDWVQYFGDILALVQTTGCDGFALHAYTHGSSPALVASDAHMLPPFSDRRYNFRVYQDFLAAVPAAMRTLPVYITETDQVEPWADVNSGWVQRAYAEIDRWNRQAGTQKIRSLVLYRWPRLDRWVIEGKQGVIEDFQAALAQDYRWDRTLEVPSTLRKGDILRTLTYVNLRKAPGYLGKPADDLVRLLAPGQRVTIVDEKTEDKDGLTWWRVRTADAPLEGWLAQYGPDGAVLVERVGSEQPPAEPPAPAPTPDLTIGDRVRTLTIVNARRSPGMVGKAPSDVLLEVPEGTVLKIVAGPREVDGLVWWRVQGTVGATAVDGWMAETTTAGQRLLERVETPGEPPAEPPATPPRFKVGDRAITVNYVRLRRSPGFMNKPADDVVADIWQGTEVTILSGPRQVDDLTWWEVKTTDSANRAVQGWMAETAPGGVPLLSPWVDEDRTPFKVGDLASVGALSVRVRRTPGYLNKADDDILGEFLPKTTLLLVAGPLTVDKLRWWRVSGVTRQGDVLGWVAETAPEGGPLLRRPSKLSGTSIPDLNQRKFLHRPFEGQYGISQLWGENAEFYGRYSYEGVALLGHNGVDFLTPLGTHVLATSAGEVTQAGFEAGGLGNYVLLAHAWGESVYGHLDSLAVQAGQRVARGAVLGRSGSSGGSTGPHLHFAIRIHPYARTDGWGGYSDPLPYMDPKDVIWPAYVLEAPIASITEGPAPVQERMPPSRMADDAPGVIRP